MAPDLRSLRVRALAGRIARAENRLDTGREEGVAIDEGIGAGLVLLIALFGGVVNQFPTETSRQIGHLIADGVLALGFLAVAVRYGSLWLGGAMLFQAAQFSLHAFFFVTQKPQNSLYGVVNNVNLFGVLVCLLIGALAANSRARTGTKIA